MRDTVGKTTANAEMIDAPNGDITQIADDANNSIKIALVAAEADDLEFFFKQGDGTLTP